MASLLWAAWEVDACCLSVLDRLPLAGLGGGEKGFDDGHIGDALFEGDGDGCALKDGAGEGVALQGVLIGGGESFRGNAGTEEVAAIVDKEARGAVGWRVEGDLDFDAAFGSEEMDALVRDELGAAGEDGVAGREVEDRGGEAVGVEVGGGRGR
jgi:hypothetical protein